MHVPALFEFESYKKRANSPMAMLPFILSMAICFGKIVDYSSVLCCEKEDETEAKTMPSFLMKFYNFSPIRKIASSNQPCMVLFFYKEAADYAQRIIL